MTAGAPSDKGGRDAARFERHVFVCTNRRVPGDPRGSCAASGSEEVRLRFVEELAKRGLEGRVRANKSGCLDACSMGPTVVVYPDQVWYRCVRPNDVAEIVERHLVNGDPVPRLRVPREAWDALKDGD